MLPLHNASVAVQTGLAPVISTVTGWRGLQLPYWTDSVHLRTPAGEHMDAAPQEERRRDRGEGRQERIRHGLSGDHGSGAEELARGLLVQNDLAAEAALDADDLLGLGVDLLGDGLELFENAGGTPP